MINYSTASGRLAILAAGVLAAAPIQGQTATPSDEPGGESLTLQVQRKSQHVREILDLLHARDIAARAIAMRAALHDRDPLVRQLAIGAYLSGFTDLTPVVVVEKGGSIGPEDTPQISLSRITWSGDNKSFNAVYNLRCLNDQNVTGQLAGGKLSIRYAGVCLSQAYRSKDADAKPDQKNNLTPASCNLILSPNDSGDELEGDLTCLQVPTVVKVRLAFGE